MKNTIYTQLYTVILLMLAGNCYADVIHGLIESCSGCSLNRLPLLKAFLLEPDGVDLYKNVQVNFIHGAKAVLTIFKGDAKEEVEKITLSDFNDTERLHKLFSEKGFEKYTDEELSANREGTMPKHFSHLAEDKSPAEVSAARENFKTAKEKLRKLKEARDNFMMDVSYVVP